MSLPNATQGCTDYVSVSYIFSRDHLSRFQLSMIFTHYNWAHAAVTNLCLNLNFQYHCYNNGQCFLLLVNLPPPTKTFDNVLYL